MFLAFQYPEEIPGVSVVNFLRQALSNRKGIGITVLELRLAIMEWMAPRHGRRIRRPLPQRGLLGRRAKKRNEILQMAMLEPEFAVLDETDSGLDIDALRTVAGHPRGAQGPA
jgi:Fe-S cluster assembly ATP-binding protein